MKRLVSHIKKVFFKKKSVAMLTFDQTSFTKKVLQGFVETLNKSAQEKISNEKKITLMASNLEGKDFGATLSFGEPPEIYGITAAFHAYSILFNGQTPSKMPITQLNEKELFLINKDVFTYQDLSISDKILSLSKHENLLL